jgi:hypothetical protein
MLTHCICNNQPGWVRVLTFIKKMEGVKALKLILENESLPPRIRLVSFGEALQEVRPSFEALRDTRLDVMLKRIAAILMVTVGLALGVVMAYPAYRFAKSRFFQSKGEKFALAVSKSDIGAFRNVGA